MWLGYGLAMTCGPVMLLTARPDLLAYLRRIDAEETMLRAALGEPYLAYRQHSRRLIPGLY